MPTSGHLFYKNGLVSKKKTLKNPKKMFKVFSKNSFRNIEGLLLGKKGIEEDKNILD